MDPWCAYLLFAQQQEAAQAPMRQRLQDLVTPSTAAAAPSAAPPAASTQRRANPPRRAAPPPPPPTSIPGSGRIARM
jgi:hypothetical protein